MFTQTPEEGGERKPPLRDSEIKQQETFRLFSEKVPNIRRTWRDGTKTHILAYDMMFDFLEESGLVVIKDNRHHQRLHGDLLKWLRESEGVSLEGRQALQPYTPFIKYVCYEKNAKIDNPGEKTRIATASLVLQAAFFYARKPSECIDYDGGGTEGGLARAYREERKRKGRTTRKPKEPQDIIAHACQETLATASNIDYSAGGNALKLVDGEPVILLVTPRNGVLHIHGWLDPIENIRAVKQMIAAAA
jgi:hypothetical protein